MPDVEFPAGLLDYLAIREEQWRQSYGLEQFRDRLTAFIDANRERDVLGPFLARLVAEATTAAFVTGMRYGFGKSSLNAQPPPDSHMFRLMREATTALGDLYPAFAVVDGRHPLQNPVPEDGDGE